MSRDAGPRAARVVLHKQKWSSRRANPLPRRNQPCALNRVQQGRCPRMASMQAKAAKPGVGDAGVVAVAVGIGVKVRRNARTLKRPIQPKQH